MIITCIMCIVCFVDTSHNKRSVVTEMGHIVICAPEVVKMTTAGEDFFFPKWWHFRFSDWLRAISVYQGKKRGCCRWLGVKYTPGHWHPPCWTDGIYWNKNRHYSMGRWPIDQTAFNTSEATQLRFRNLTCVSYWLGEHLTSSDRSISSWWLQMDWRPLGTRPWATTMLTRVWF